MYSDTHAQRPRFAALGPALIAALLLAGCATGYQAKSAGAVDGLRSGSVDLALADLEKQNSDTDKDLLYHLEKGELQRAKGLFTESRDNWLLADGKIRQWEETAKNSPDKLLGELGALVVNDTTRRYDGRDFEKVFVSVRLAQNHLALGDWNAARVEIKKMHEREAIIAEFRAKELEAAKKSASDKGLKVTSFKDLNGYPVETLEDPEVVALKNSYESAYANYLAGFVYEALGETSLAAAGYNKAIQMRANSPLLQDGLSGLDARVSAARRRSGVVDTLIVVESGSAPSIHSQQLPLFLPIPGRHGIGIVATPISWPVIRAESSTQVPASIMVNDRSLPLSLLTSVDQMARRALRDEMPSIIARSSIRAITRGIAQKAIDDNAGQMGGFGALVGVFAKVATVVTEKADERGWRTLPNFFSVARVSLPAGEHRIAISTGTGTQTRTVKLSGSHALVALRHTGGNLYLAQTPSVESAAETVASAEHTAVTTGATQGTTAQPQAMPARTRPAPRTAPPAAAQPATRLPQKP